MMDIRVRNWKNILQLFANDNVCCQHSMQQAASLTFTVTGPSRHSDVSNLFITPTFGSVSTIHILARLGNHWLLTNAGPACHRFPSKIHNFRRRREKVSLHDQGFISPCGTRNSSYFDHGLYEHNNPKICGKRAKLPLCTSDSAVYANSP